MIFLTLTLTFWRRQILYTCVCIIVREICTAGPLNRTCQPSLSSFLDFNQKYFGFRTFCVFILYLLSGCKSTQNHGLLFCSESKVLFYIQHLPINEIRAFKRNSHLLKSSSNGLSSIKLIHRSLSESSDDKRFHLYAQHDQL